MRAIDAPANFRHLVSLIDAERAWAHGDVAAAALAFDHAIGEAETRNRPWHRALILQRAALFSQLIGHHWQARQLLAKARHVYADWGAVAKVRQLDDAHPFLRTATTDHDERRRSTSVLNADAIDTMAILRASQALSSATDLTNLQQAIVDQLTVMTGASEVRLLIRDEETGDWFLPSGSRGAGVDLNQAAATGQVPMSAVQYARRTREPLLVEDATQDDRFAHDIFLAGAQRCSLLVVPVLHSDTLRAMLVLANRHTSGLFTADRLDAVELITGQLVVSLNNALLYASLEQRVADRTRELAAANQKLEVLSTTDALTGLANRREFERVLEKEWRRTDRTADAFGIIMIDVDHFKKYNDRYGHQAGDDCLRRVGRTIADSLRTATDIACRYGGEEFVVVLSRTDADGARMTAERIRGAIGDLRIPHVMGVAGTISVSIGVAFTHADPGDDPMTLVARADTALYAAKEAGRDRVCVAEPPKQSL